MRMGFKVDTTDILVSSRFPVGAHSCYGVYVLEKSPGEFERFQLLFTLPCA